MAMGLPKCFRCGRQPCKCKDGVTLYHGDCLEIMPLLGQSSVDMVLCDPPYGMTVCAWDSVIPLELMWENLRRLVKTNAAMVFTAAQPFTSALVMSNAKAFKYEWIWQKESGTGFLNSSKQPLSCHESVLVFYDKLPIYHPQFTRGKSYACKSGASSDNYGKHNCVKTVSNGKRFPISVLSFKRETDKIHPTQKPVALMSYLLKTYTDEGATVLDFAAGSGSTGVACIGLGRRCILIEKEQAYCDVIVKRLRKKVKDVASSFNLR